MGSEPILPLVISSAVERSGPWPGLLCVPNQISQLRDAAHHFGRDDGTRPQRI